MDSERWQKIDQLFHAALDRESGERAAFLSAACAGDDALCEEVQALLDSHEQSQDFIEESAGDLAASLLVGGDLKLKKGQKVGPYRVLSLIAEGGMGQVYLARDVRLGRRVALKLLPAEFTLDAERVRRFEQEARAASALNHPNIVTIHEIGRVNSLHFMTTEFIDGKTLSRHVGSFGTNLDEVLDIGLQVASALEAAHAAGIIHRDIKPENIMVRQDGIVKVLDFGLAKLSPHQVLSVESKERLGTLVKTNPGMVVGTVQYMSPEQARGAEVDARTDIWSLGVLLYELIAGCLPFAGSAKSEILAAILNEKEPPPLARFAREVPPELERIVDKAIRKDREERYQVIRDMLLDLRSLKHQLEFEAELERSIAPNAEIVRQTITQRRPVTRGTLRNSAQFLGTEFRKHRRAVVFGLPVVLLAVVLAYFFYFAKTAKAIGSIAVVPLVNTTNDPNTEYLSDGITESIISNLSQLPGLKVMARSTVFRFKGQEVDPQEVGRKLGVQVVLMGRMRQQGDNLIIKTELVNVGDGTQLWGAEYDRKLADALSIQRDVSREIYEKLRLRLTGEEKEQMSRRVTTSNAEAYQSYLKGRYYWNKRTAEGITKAIQQFQEAADKDPNYALAYAGLADCYMLLEGYVGTPATETLPKAKAFAERALQIDDSSGEARASLANISAMLWQWDKAGEEFKRAIELNPNYATAHHWYSIYLRHVGRFDEALSEIKRAQELDPLSIVINTNVAQVYLAKGDANSAIEQGKKVIELDPNYPGGHRILAQAFARQGQYAEALAVLQKAIESSGRASEYQSYQTYLYAISGKRAESLANLKQLEERYARHDLIGFDLAMVYTGLGDKDQAFAWLEKDLQTRSGLLPYVRWDPFFEPLRSDPRFANLMKRIGLKS
jgi:serine/threonine protein kinase/tetratricopeptide (TPR) repeat protein